VVLDELGALAMIVLAIGGVVLSDPRLNHPDFANDGFSD